MADISDTREHMGLSAKLLTLFRMRRAPDGYPPSTREIAQATKAPGQRAPRLSHGQVNTLLNGSGSNPRSSTIMLLAQALDAPAAFLLEGSEWDDLTALTVFRDRPEAREVLRLLQGLDVQDIAETASILRKMRRDAGLPDHVPTIPPAPPGVDQPREGRPRRRLSLNEAAERAAADLEGL
jgi:transcriptional regulator with XRE-family HTH domain